MAGLTEVIVKKFIESKLETERPKIMAHLEAFVKNDMKEEIIDELGELITEKFTEIEGKLEKVKPDSGWF